MKSPNSIPGWSPAVCLECSQSPTPRVNLEEVLHFPHDLTAISSVMDSLIFLIIFPLFFFSFIFVGIFFFSYLSHMSEAEAERGQG